MEAATLRDHRQLANETVVPVKDVVFVRTLNGIGDTLNGLVTAYWLSAYLNATFSVCWPESEGVISWRVALAPPGCLAWKTQWERRTREFVLSWERGSQRSKAIEYAGLSMLVSEDTAFVRYEATSGGFYAAYGKGDWAALRTRPTLMLSSNRGITTFAYTDRTDKTGLSAWLRSRFTSPWSAAGSALRQVVRLAAPRPRDICVHYRAARMMAVPVEDIVACAATVGSSATRGSVKVFSDVGSRHLMVDLAIDPMAGLQASAGLRKANLTSVESLLDLRLNRGANMSSYTQPEPNPQEISSNHLCARYCRGTVRS